MPATVHALTPALAVRDPRGLALRQVSYCRRQAAGPVERRVQGNQQDALGRLLACRDPRLWALHQQDSATPANLRQVHSLSGRVLGRDSVDSGMACTLFGEAGQVMYFEDGRGSRREFEYDPLLRPVALHEQGAGQQRGCSERYSYAGVAAEHAARNACGRLLRHDDTAGSIQIPGYSLVGEVNAQVRRFSLLPQWPDWPQPVAERDALLEPEGAASVWRHGPLGDVLEQRDAAGNRQVIGLTLAGELRQVCVQPAGASERSLLVEARYNAFGQIEDERLGNGVHLQRRYRDEDGRLQQLSARRTNGELLQDLHYGYDPAGNVLSIEDQALPVRYFANQRIEPVCTYAYDSLEQLIEATGWEAGAASRGPGSLNDPQSVSNYRQVYDYDAGGNLLGLTHTGAQAHSRELVAAQYANRCLPANQDFDASFDANGNLRQLQPGQALAWNLRNELREVRPVTRESGVDDWEGYFYDAAGQRARKLGSAAAARRIHTREVRYLPGLEQHRNSREQFDVMIVQAGTCSVRILHWHAGRPDEVAQDQVRYALADHLGSSSLELDADAALISHEVFHPFGSTAWWAARNEIEAGYKTVRYSAKERDATGLYYYGARYYRTDWQRWLSPDPGGEVDGLNLYRMVLNNPLGNVDEDGLETTSAQQRWQRLVRTHNRRQRGQANSVATIAPGIVRVTLSGGPELFEAAGMQLGERFSGVRKLTYLSIDASYAGKIAARERGRGLIPLKTLAGSLITQISNTSSADFTAFINGGYFNFKKALASNMPRASSVGPSFIDGGKGASVPLPELYQSYYTSLTMPDGSSLSVAPLLGEGGQRRFTEAELENPDFQFDDDLNWPGWLTHSSEGNTRSGISVPGDAAGRTRLAVGVTKLRGEDSSGYTMPEWASVMTRLDNLNTVPGRSFNLDGGASSALGVVSRTGDVLFRGGLRNNREVGNFIAYARRH